MFGAKYSRLKFWIISISLLIPTAMLNTFAKILETSEKDEISLFLYLIVTILSSIWINTLANRIRDFGNNPWYALLSLIPLVNIGMALYYGSVKKKLAREKDVKRQDTSLPKAIINHANDITSDIKPKVNTYIEKHSKVGYNDNYSVTLEHYSNTEKLSEDKIYEKVILEIEEDKKVKSTWARAFAQTDGNESKAHALYVNLRVEEIILEDKNIAILSKQKIAENYKVSEYDEAIYKEVADELSNNMRKEGLWLKAIEKTNGDENKALALYIKYRSTAITEKKLKWDKYKINHDKGRLLTLFKNILKEYGYYQFSKTTVYKKYSDNNIALEVRLDEDRELLCIIDVNNHEIDTIKI